MPFCTTCSLSTEDDPVGAQDPLWRGPKCSGSINMVDPVGGNEMNKWTAKMPNT